MAVTATIASPLTTHKSRSQTLSASIELFWLAGLAAVVSSLLARDWLAGLAVIVLWFSWRVIRHEEGPPVLSLACSFQWVFAASGLFYYPVLGRYSRIIAHSDYRPMVLLSLLSLAALAIGLAFGSRVARRRFRPDARPQHSLGVSGLLWLYLLTFLASGTLQQLAWYLPGLTQAIIVSSYFRLIALYLVLRVLVRQRGMFTWYILLVGAEVALGFTSYYSGWKEPLFFATMAALEVFRPRRALDWMLCGTLAMMLFLFGVLWIGVRNQYREEITSGTLGSSKKARISRITDLSIGWINAPLEEKLTDCDTTLFRVWDVYYPALALERVPSKIPHTNGMFLKNALKHVLTPRLLFPNKPPLMHDSDKVRQFSGQWVAGVERGVSINFNYVIESYIDWGVPMMLVPIFLYGLFMGYLYRWFQRIIVHRDLAVAFTAVVFWLCLYNQRSWDRTIGLGITVLVVTGGAIFVLDRFLLGRYRSKTGVPWHATHAPSQ